MLVSAQRAQSSLPHARKRVGMRVAVSIVLPDGYDADPSRARPKELRVLVPRTVMGDFHDVGANVMMAHE